jgi:hypothetical protein
MPVFASRSWRAAKFSCTECGAAFRTWIDDVAPVKFAVGEFAKERCPRCRRATYFELDEIVEVPVPPRHGLPPESFE